MQDKKERRPRQAIVVKPSGKEDYQRLVAPAPRRPEPPDEDAVAGGTAAEPAPTRPAASRRARSLRLTPIVDDALQALAQHWGIDLNGAVSVAIMEACHARHIGVLEVENRH